MRVSLRIKLLFYITIIVGIVFIFLLAQTLNREREILQNNFKDKAGILALALDANINSRQDLENKEKLQNNIYKFIWLYPEIAEISISIPKEDSFEIIASNDTSKIGTLVKNENLTAFQEDKLITKNVVMPDGSEAFNAITPIRVGGERVGVYDIKILLESEEKIIQQRQKEIIFTISSSIVAIILFLFLILTKVIIVPIEKVREGIKRISSGNLDWRLDIKRNDEIGILSQGFNQMADKLKELYYNLEKKIEERTKELEEAKNILEIKVAARTRELQELVKEREKIIEERTKELQRKIDELEKFHKLAVGRELKMIELKKELEKIKTQNQKAEK